MSESVPLKRGRKSQPLPAEAPTWAARLRVARESAGLSQEELASRCRAAGQEKLTARAVGHYERGTSPSVQAAIALARSLGSTVEELFG